MKKIQTQNGNYVLIVIFNMNNFIKQTSLDYDMDYNFVLNIYNKVDKNIELFYQKLEEEFSSLN